MSHWNYRVCKETYRKGEPSEEVGFTIREVYYNALGEIWAVSENAVGVFGESVIEVGDALAKMKAALDKEVIDLDTIVYAKSNSEE